ncbi:hypothetical protein A3B21_03160 [Candidatus Uhrbacteria bacterium RIFCSPLOWO2_01_FULL_47_24]|uniref:NYN domain-containing protein n=1 Tax=Candidatus Uhrbacteria bacterium RIFCSPLOWO2_01_FULL_47_24 TaxID=1802401 RepID=A0A1F7URM3_9BACT|nr:MAG: hypothetical protein A2753_05090 [Candidatus Uhrbacteria bacterium RIFCSPHIGHO2_01_FULL_47_11]OGL67586.1 MAG: hypothetical protein A3D58_03760 [Candidatus Uhrbacteria bacterium RIFCSPHIGHO2_02_FULL_46_47]OGL75777.1 MAG: hypothetical protein A3F52_05575 [Candidatus Uhrbacteria bacterium RIFCSPHIGHO2_12_FULL_47_11]OGL80940.1 MAG: hypothetical protein A3B21_03160 [Candidatus Uhrbacteria bacterium RIFCSPLOWO2_01_FULL_47_24]OGL84275.1 MAG: hypothetical protein A3J03_03160 [Candidatus Uhrbact
MFKEFVRGKTIVFIDASNIYHSQKTLEWRIDLQKLIELLHREVDFFSAYYYLAYDPENSAQRKFIDFLEIIGYQVRKKPIKFIKDDDDERGGYHKGNLDVDLVIDALHNRDLYESVILFSGDSDFESLIKYLKSFRKQCIVVSTKGHISIELIKQAKFIDLKKCREMLELQK